MATLPYADLDAPEVKPLVDQIVAQRGSVLHLYQMLLHSAPLTEGWLAYLTAIRKRLSLDGALRELVIMRVAALNGAQFEADHHAPIALLEGISREQLDALHNWRNSTQFSPREQAVLALTDTMTLEVKVPAGVMGTIREYLDDREVVELVATIAAYNMVSRFLVALDIGSHDKR